MVSKINLVIRNLEASQTKLSDENAQLLETLFQMKADKKHSESLLSNERDRALRYAQKIEELRQEILVHQTSIKKHEIVTTKLEVYQAKESHQEVFFILGETLDGILGVENNIILQDPNSSKLRVDLKTYY